MNVQPQLLEAIEAIRPALQADGGDMQVIDYDESTGHHGPTGRHQSSISLLLTVRDFTLLTGVEAVIASHDDVRLVVELHLTEPLHQQPDFLRRAESGTEHKRSRWLDFLMGPGLLADQYARTHGRKVGEVMTPNVKSVDEHTSLGDIVAMMERGSRG